MDHQERGQKRLRQQAETAPFLLQPVPQAIQLGSPLYDKGKCVERLMAYMSLLTQRPRDNNIEFWNNVVAEFFAPYAIKRLCNSAFIATSQNDGFSLQDKWVCELCNTRPTRGFEATADKLPRLLKDKCEAIHAHMYLESPREELTSSGLICLSCDQATREAMLGDTRVVRRGKLRLTFTLDLKLCSWEFCATHHEEFIPKTTMIQKVSQISGTLMEYYANRNILDMDGLRNTCDRFAAFASSLLQSTQRPCVNAGGYGKNNMSSIRISNNASEMKDLMLYSIVKGNSPTDTMAKYIEEFLSAQVGNLGIQPEQQSMSRRMPLHSKGRRHIQNPRPVPKVYPSFRLPSQVWPQTTQQTRQGHGQCSLPPRPPNYASNTRPSLGQHIQQPNVLQHQPMTSVRNENPASSPQGFGSSNGSHARELATVPSAIVLTGISSLQQFPGPSTRPTTNSPSYASPQLLQRNSSQMHQNVYSNDHPTYGQLIQQAMENFQSENPATSLQVGSSNTFHAKNLTGTATIIPTGASGVRKCVGSHTSPTMNPHLYASPPSSQGDDICLGDFVEGLIGQSTRGELDGLFGVGSTETNGKGTLHVGENSGVKDMVVQKGSNSHGNLAIEASSCMVTEAYEQTGGLHANQNQTVVATVPEAGSTGSSAVMRPEDPNEFETLLLRFLGEENPENESS